MKKTQFIVAGLLVMLCWGCAQSKENKLPPSLQEQPVTTAVANANIDSSRQNAIVTATRKASPGVVTVVATMTMQTTYNPFFDDPFFRDWSDMFGGFPGQTMERKVKGSGSGFIFDPNGYIMTAEHVVHGAQSISVILPTGKQYPATLVGSDFAHDIAVLKIDDTNLPSMEMGSSTDLMVGEWAIAIGSPFWGAVKEPTPTITVGVVSAIGRSFRRSGQGGFRVYENLIQTDAAINPGNSGGPLVNSLGQVIGVNTAIITPSGGNVGIGFAVGIDQAKDSARKIINGSGLTKSTLGVYLIALTPEVQEETGLKGINGLLVADVDGKGAAAKSGIRSGDVIVNLDGKDMKSIEDYDNAMRDLVPGKEVSLTINRAGREMKGKVTLGSIE